MRRGLAITVVGVLLVAGLAHWASSELEPIPEVSQPQAKVPSPPEVASARPRPLPPVPDLPPSADAGAPQEPLPLPLPVPLDAGLPALPPVEEDAGVAPPAPAPEPAPAPAIDAGGRKTSNDPRFGVRWGQPGLCGDEPLEKLAARRARLLSSFAVVKRAGALVFHDPEAPISTVDAVGRSLTVGRRVMGELLGARGDVEPPVFYVYASVEQLRDVACVNTATQGYYDGAIHLHATDATLEQTVIHEYTHHVLNTLGVQKPMWFHEGLAMWAAAEDWFTHPELGLAAWLRTNHLPFESLTEAFPHTSDELFASAAYYQSYMMVRFIARQRSYAWFVQGLLDGTYQPEASFSQAAGLRGDDLERAWKAHVLRP